MTNIALPPVKETQSRGWVVWFLLHLAIHGAAWLLILASVPVVANFERMFKEFEIELPMVTKVAIANSQRLVQLWWLYTLIFLVVDGGLLFGLHQLPRDARGLRWAWVAVVPIGVLVYLLWVAFVISMGFVTLQSDLSG